MDNERETAFSDGAGNLDKNVREYMRAMAMKSVAVQAKKYGKKKFSEMGKKAGLTHTRKALERKDRAGELPNAVLT